MTADALMKTEAIKAGTGQRKQPSLRGRFVFVLRACPALISRKPSVKLQQNPILLYVKSGWKLSEQLQLGRKSDRDRKE